MNVKNQQRNITTKLMERIKIKRCPNFRHVVQCTCPKEVCRIVEPEPLDQNQTAVEWLWNLSKERELDIFDLDQAMKMQEEQIIDAWCAAAYDSYNDPTKTADRYYKETYNK